MKNLLPTLILTSIPFLTHGMSEDDRLNEYHARGYEWPFQKLVPDTPGWKNIFKRRFEQIDRIEDSNLRYNAWVQVMSSALTSPNFTENG